MSDLLIERRPSRNRIAIALVPVMMVGAVLFSNVGDAQNRELTGGAVGAAGGAIIGAIAGAPLVGALAGVAGGVALVKVISSHTSGSGWPCLIYCEPAEVVKLPGS
jgi:osmotically inducible lipoprotein OsmB